MQAPNEELPSLDLVRMARDGNAQALSDLFERYRPRLLERIRWMMGAEARRVAESGDFLQASLIEMMDALDRFEVRNERQLLRWMTTIARNNIRDTTARRRERALESISASWRRERNDPSTPTPRSEADRNESIVKLIESIEQLQPDHRLVIELRDLEQLPFQEIGAQMERSDEAARKLHARALLALSDLMM